MHLKGVGEAPRRVARHAPAQPPDDGGIPGHAGGMGMYLHLVAQVAHKLGVGCQLWKV